MAYRICRSLAALLGAYLLVGLAIFVIREIGEYGSRPLVERLFTDTWREIQCYLFSPNRCCGWGYRYNCPLTMAYIGAVFALVFSIIPVTIIMLIVRRFGLPRPLSEMLTGGGLGLIAAVLVAQIPNSDNTYPNLVLMPFIIPGVIGGLTYWLLAGRPRNESS